MPTTDARYPNMNFPDWEFQEYPKFLWNEPGYDKDSPPTAIIAKSPEDEQALLKARDDKVAKAKAEANPTPAKPAFAPAKS